MVLITSLSLQIDSFMSCKFSITIITHIPSMGQGFGYKSQSANNNLP